MNEAFFKAAAEGNTAHLKEIYQESGKELNPNQTFGDYQEFPLFTAAKNGHAETVKFLLECKDNPINPHQLAKGGWSPLCIAALGGHLEVVKILVDFFNERPSYINQTTEEGLTPLFLAAQGGHADIVNVLLEAGADTNLSFKGNTPLDIAVINDQTNVYHILDGHAQNFHTALIQRMKILDFTSNPRGVCEGFSKNIKNLIISSNDSAIIEYYKMLAWLKKIKADDLYLIKYKHDFLIIETEKEVRKHFNLEEESYLSPAQRTAYQKMLKKSLALRRSTLSPQEQKDEYRYRYICALFNSVEFGHNTNSYLHILPKYILQFLPNHEQYIKSQPLNGQIILTRGKNNSLKYKTLFVEKLNLKHQITLDELKNELGDKYSDFKEALLSNDAVRLNFYVENILHIITLHKEIALERRGHLGQFIGRLWTNPVVQPQTLEKKGGEAQLTTFTGVYQFNEIVTYLIKLKNRIYENTEITTPIALTLSSINHIILVAYHPSKHVWEFVDINQMPSNHKKIKRIFLTDEKAIAEKIQKGFFSNEYTTFNTLVTSTQDAYNQLQPMIMEWENDLRTIHAPTPEKIQFTDCFKGSWFLVAVKWGDVNTIEKLLAYKDCCIDVNKPDERNITALFTAAENNNIHVLNILLKCRTINPNIPDEEGVSPLFVATGSNNLEAMKALLNHSLIDPNKGDLRRNITPLYITAQNGYTEAVKALLDHSLIDPNKGCLEQNVTPLFIAAQNGHTEAVKSLLNHSSIDPNQALKNGVTPLLIASENGHIEVVKALLSHPKILINQVTSDGSTALDMAIKNNHNEIIQIFRAYKVKKQKVIMNDNASISTENSHKRLKLRH